MRGKEDSMGSGKWELGGWRLVFYIRKLYIDRWLKLLVNRERSDLKNIYMLFDF